MTLFCICKCINAFYSQNLLCFIKIRIFKAKDLSFCKSTEKCQLDLKIAAGFGRLCKKLTKLVNGIKNRFSCWLRIVFDLLKINRSNISIFTG